MVERALVSICKRISRDIYKTEWGMCMGFKTDEINAHAHFCLARSFFSPCEFFWHRWDVTSTCEWPPAVRQLWGHMDKRAKVHVHDSLRWHCSCLPSINFNPRLKGPCHYSGVMMSMFWFHRWLGSFSFSVPGLHSFLVLIQYH